MNIFTGLFKFGGWIFGFNKQYQAHRISYGKGGLAGRITLLVLYLGLTALTVWLEFVTYDLFTTNFVYAILMSILVIGLITLTVKESAIYSVIAFQHFATTKIGEAIDDKIQDSINKNFELKDGEIVKREDELTEEQLEDLKVKPKKQYRWFDIVSGIVYALISAGLFVGSIILLFMKISQTA